MSSELQEYRSRPAKLELSRKLKIVATVLSVAVLGLVIAMQRIRLPLPEGWDTSMLPPLHACINALAAVVLIAAVVFIKKGKVRAHQRAMTIALFLSIGFLLSYVSYHITNDPTRYGGEGPMRAIYLTLLLTHIIAAAVSFPFILFTLIAALTNRFQDHRRMARWVFPVWLYVALTGPICYLMLRPFY